MLRAIWFSSIFWIKVERIAALPRLLGAAHLIWLALSGRGARAAPERAAARLASCRECPVFCAELGTCGSPKGLVLPKPGQEPEPGMAGRVWWDMERKWYDVVGCLCHMPLKVKLDDSTCWARDVFGDDALIGWPEELSGASK